MMESILIGFFILFSALFGFCLGVDYANGRHEAEEERRRVAESTP